MTETRYRLTGRIAAGELADSFQAVRGEFEPVVIKLFQAGTSDARYARELAQLARRLISVRDSGILHVIDLGFTADRLAVVREHTESFNLGQVLSRLTAWGIMLPTPLALFMVSELSETVRRAHEAGAVHGGITPGNILLSADGQPTLSDFGALQALSAVPELRARFVPAGRGSYRSQEVERGEAATEQSDVFSLGAVAYQLLTLREVSPDREGSTSPRSPHPVSSQIDQRLYPILMKSMETIPQLRYRSCAEFSEALRQFLTESQIWPTRQDLQKFLRDVFPEGAKLPSADGEIPFAEPFALEPVEGAADLATISATVHAERRGPEGSEAVHAERRGPQATGVEAATARTAPGGFEAAWYAPPDPTRQPNQIPARIDPSAKSGPFGTEGVPPPIAEYLAAPARSTASLPRERALSTSGRGEPELTPTDSALGHRWSMGKRQALGLTLSALIAGSFAVGLVIWWSGRASKPRPETNAPIAPVATQVATGAQPASTAVTTPPKPTPETPPSGQSAPRAAATKPARTEPPVEWDAPPRKGAGYLSIVSDVPTIVYIDGRRVRKPTPLKRYPVQPGVRKISLVAVDTRERRDFVLRFAKGQLRKLDEVFDHPSARR